MQQAHELSTAHRVYYHAHDQLRPLDTAGGRLAEIMRVKRSAVRAPRTCLDGSASGEDGHVVDAQRHVLVVPPAALVRVEDLVAQLLARLRKGATSLDDGLKASGLRSLRHAIYGGQKHGVARAAGPVACVFFPATSVDVCARSPPENLAGGDQPATHLSALA